MENKNWWKESVVYEIYPRSFADSNGDGIGDLVGIMNKLDYLAELGIDVIWICPFYPSPGYDNGYDISNYEAIDPAYGNMTHFTELIQEAHIRGIKVVIDIVVNHTSMEHPWFKAACKSRNDPKHDWYIWRNPEEDREYPNNWGALFGGPAWTYVEEVDAYYLHLFSPQQPDLNWDNRKLRQEVYAMMRRWIQKGVDGFRMDVISLIAKPEDFSDGELGASGYYDPRERIAANPKLHTFLREMRQMALQEGNIMTVGEASATTIEEARRLSNLDGSELNMVFQFQHMDLDGGETFKWNDKTIPLPGLKQVMGRWQMGMEQAGWNALFWDNHDQPRMLSRMGDEGALREKSAKMLALCLHMLKGTPFIYQGDEIGMINMEFTSVDQLRDSESINAYEKYTSDGSISKTDMLRFISLKSRDNARIPMQWSSQPQGGFSQGKPWMDVSPDYLHTNVEEQIGREDSVLSFYKKLIRLRHNSQVIIQGEFIPYKEEHPGVFAYRRILGEEEILVCCNFTRDVQQIELPEGYQMNHCRILLCNEEESGYIEEGRLTPYEAIAIYNPGTLQEENK